MPRVWLGSRFSGRCTQLGWARWPLRVVRLRFHYTSLVVYACNQERARAFKKLHTQEVIRFEFRGDLWRPTFILAQRHTPAFQNLLQYRHSDSKIFSGNTFAIYCVHLMKIGLVTQMVEFLP